MKDVFIHELADVKTVRIGARTKIWQFTIILENAVIGKNCNINCHCFIENDVIIGDDVTVKSGNYLWDGLRIGNSVFIGPNVTFINDKYPRSKQYPDEFLPTIIEDGVSIGAGSTIMGGIVIGRNSMIGAGSLVLTSVRENSLYYGHPAKYIKLIK